MSESFVYILTLTKTGVFYIGSTSHLDVRIKRHLNELHNGTHHNERLLQAWTGTDEEILINAFDQPNREAAFRYEEELINKVYNSPRSHLLANISLNSRAGDMLTNHPNKEAVLAKRANAQKVKLKSLSAEERKTIYGKPGKLNGMFGRTHSQKTREKLSKTMTGHSFNKGIKLSPEHIEKIRERQRLRTGSKNSFYGKKHKPETIALLKKANSGKIPTNARDISASGLRFKSCADASRYFEVSKGLVTHRLKSKHYPDWFYIDND